jgi:hypothetical protein
MSPKKFNENVPIVVVSGQAGKTYSPADRRQIRQIVRDRLLKIRTEPYHKVQVEVEFGPDGNPKTLVASMLRARTYTADIVTINVDARYHVLSIEPDSL